MSIKQKVVSGLKWSLFAKLLAQLFSWVSTFLIIRILSPEDYGIVALAMSFVLFGNLFSAGGFIASIVKKQSKSGNIFSQMFTIAFISSFFIACIIIIFAPSFSDFYRNDNFTAVLYVMSLSIVLNSFLIVPTAHLNIDMDFKSKAICDSISVLIASVSSLICAYLGFAYWSLIIAYLIQTCSKIIAYHYVCRAKYSLTIDFKGTKDILNFAYTNQANGLLWLGYNQIDNILIGRFLGIDLLGVYNVAKDVASLPMMKVAEIMNQVGFSAYASLKEDKNAANYYLERSLKLIAIFVFPIFLGISAVSNEIIFLILGDKWIEAAPIISILCFVFPFRMMNTNVQLYVNGMNKPKFNLINTIIMATSMIVVLFFATQVSLIVTAMSWVITFCCIFLLILFRLHYLFNIDFKTLSVWVFPFVTSLFMWLFIYFVNFYFLETIENHFFILLIKIIIGITIILPVYYKLYKLEVINIFKEKNAL